MLLVDVLQATEDERQRLLLSLQEITVAYTDSGNRMSAYELAERMYLIAADALEPLPKP